MKTRRLSRTEYIEIKMLIIELLPEMKRIAVQEVIKDYYGDIDFYHHADPQLEELIRQRLTPLRFKKNGPTFTIDYDGVQVDFHTAKDPDFCPFFYHGGWSVVLCSFIAPHPFLLREDGLWTYDKFKLSNNPYQILTYLGIDHSAYDTMQTEEEVLTVFCTSWLYQPSLLSTFPPRVLFRSLMKRLYISRPPVSSSLAPSDSAIDWFGKRSEYDAWIQDKEDKEREAETKRHQRRLMLDFFREQGYEGMELSEKIQEGRIDK